MLTAVLLPNICGIFLRKMNYPKVQLVQNLHKFFDWDNKGSSGPQDGQSDHVGIVEKCENGIVYTIEGNSGDSCRQRQYPVGHYEILGYGVPAY